MSVLEVNNVSIRYITGDFKDIGLKEYVMRKLTRNYRVKEFWADKNVSFSLEKGEMLGIIGTNGAGKSTLLKVVSGIMEPTEGNVHREGNVSALLELASGFDGDLTVKENAYLRGAMLGYTRKFMDESYEQIIDFAELKEFEDRPFKQLSSGMKSRLAFSVASMVQPDLLILDEVLSVGDGAFRKKSEKKMNEIMHGGAATILVSHSLEQVRALCTKILWLHRGRQIACGDNVQEICDQYQRFLNSGSQKNISPLSLGRSGSAYYSHDTVSSSSVSSGVVDQAGVKNSPDSNCLREELVESLWQYMGFPEPVGPNPFKDIGENDICYKAALWAFENGLLNDIASPEFSPQSPCTRSEVITMIWKLTGKPELSLKNPFEDVTDDSPAYSAILWAVDAGITKGKTPTSFSPDSPCTKRQVATFLNRLSKYRNS